MAAASVVIVGAVAIAGTLTVQSAQAQDRLAAAVAELEEAEALIPAAQSELAAATDDYAALGAERTDAAAAITPVLARLAGMSDDAARAAVQAALDALGAETDATPATMSAAYTPSELDSTDLEALGAAVDEADAYRKTVTSASERVRAEAAALEDRIGAVQAAILALAATLPSWADRIAAENPLPAVELRDAVLTAAAAAAAAATADDRAASLSAMDSYASAVAALRDEQVRMTAEQSLLREREQRAPQAPRSQPTKNSTPDLGAAPGQAPATPAPAAPVPQPDAQPQPQPQPQPEPQPPQPQPQPQPEPEPNPGPGDDWPWGDWPFQG